MTFKDFNLHPSLMEGIESMGFKAPTPVQEKVIPHLLSNQDAIACAQTGTGKTAAYLLPTMHHILASKSHDHHINTIIIAPTRELAVQIDQQVEGFAYFTPVSSLAVYGGGDSSSFDIQKKALQKGADIIIATPGRLLSHLSLGYVAVDRLHSLILDEADKMLDMGFFEDLMRIVHHLPKERQTMMFSATMPPKIRQLANKILNNPVQVDIAISKPAEGILQVAYMAYDNQKNEVIKYLLKGKNLRSVVIFTATKSAAKDLEKALRKEGIQAFSIHSDLEQKEREDVLNKFKARKVQVLVATNILSRGIDIEGIDLVINYNVPKDAEDYVHRIGRTARAESTGVAITFINDKEQREFARIEELIEKKVPKQPLPAEIGQGPEFSYSSKKGGSGGGKKSRSGGYRGRR